MIAACKDDAQRELLASTYTIGPVGVNCNDGTHVVIIASKLSGKAGTLQWVCEHLGDGYEPQTVAAFGDGTNDTAMFAVAGWSCAPANGEPEAREKASAVSVLTNADAPVNFIAAQLDAFVEQQQ
jgi:hydroxymethylpyrimidine pyrophosphatase-like HAD family hydrolase